MGIINSIKEWLGIVKDAEQIIEEYSMPWERNYGVQAPSTIENYLDQYGEAGWVYACVRRIATKAAEADMKFYRQTASDQEDEKEEISHVLKDIMANPNEHMSEFELKVLRHQHLELVGEAFWYIAENGVGGPGAIYPLMPHLVRVVPGEEKMIRGYVYGRGENKVTYEPDEIIHFKYPNPDPESFFRGASPIGAARYSVATDQNAEKWNYNFFKNSAKPGGYLQTDKKMDGNEVKRLISLWEKHHQGTDNAHKVAVAQQGMEYKETGLSHEDMDFVNQLDKARDKTLAIYGVPKSLLGIVEDVNRANAEVDKRNFAENTIAPALKLVESTINQFILNNYTEDVFVEHENVVPRDKEYILKKHELYLKTGTLTINEVRAENGREPVPWGDQPFNPQMQMTLSNDKVVDIDDFERYQGLKKKSKNGPGNYTEQSRPVMKDGKNTEIDYPNARMDLSGL